MGDCSSTDNTCLCKNQYFIDSVTSCLQKTCSSDEVETANAGAQEICKSVVSVGSPLSFDVAFVRDDNLVVLPSEHSLFSSNIC